MGFHIKKAYTPHFGVKDPNTCCQAEAKPYKILEHKADLKIKVFGKTKKELFCCCLLAMTESMRSEVRGPEGRIRKKIKIKSLDLASLLVDFLNEALYLSQTNKEIYFDLKFSKFSDNEIEGELIGQKVERFGEDIKAVTYHDLNINQKRDGSFEAIVLFDI